MVDAQQELGARWHAQISTASIRDFLRGAAHAAVQLARTACLVHDHSAMPPALLLPKPLQVSERREPGHPTACSSARRGQALAVPEPQACRQADRVRASASSAALSVSYSPKYASSETPLEGHAPVSSPIHKVELVKPTPAAQPCLALSQLTLPGVQVHSPEELRALVAEHRDQLSVLMCKAKSCRPCKAFSRRCLVPVLSLASAKRCWHRPDLSAGTCGWRRPSKTAVSSASMATRLLTPGEAPGLCC